MEQRTVRGHVDVHIEVRSNEHAVSLTMRVDSRVDPSNFWHRTAELSIELQLGSEPRCLLNGTVGTWDMLEHSSQDDCFAAANQWLQEQVDEAWQLGALTDWKFPTARRELTDMADLTARLAVQRCDPVSREYVLRLSPELRFRWYRWATGRHVPVVGGCRRLTTVRILATDSASAQARA